MNPLLLVLTASLLCSLPAAAQTTYARTSNGTWSDAAGWSPAGVPGPADTADLNGRTVTLEAATTVAVLVFPPGVNSVLGVATGLTVTDTLRWEAGQSNMTDTLTVGPQATLRVRGTANLRMGTGACSATRGGWCRRPRSAGTTSDVSSTRGRSRSRSTEPRPSTSASAARIPRSRMPPAD